MYLSDQEVNWWCWMKLRTNYLINILSGYKELCAQLQPLIYRSTGSKYLREWWFRSMMVEKASKHSLSQKVQELGLISSAFLDSWSQKLETLAQVHHLSPLSKTPAQLESRCGSLPCSHLIPPCPAAPSLGLWTSWEKNGEGGKEKYLRARGFCKCSQRDGVG